MALIRSELSARLAPWSETAGAVAAGAAGLWLASLGGFLLLPAGLALAAVSAVWAIGAFRRMRFRQAVAAPGMVEVDEGQIGYLGPAFGGYVALPDLTEIRLLTMGGRRLWRLKQKDGQVLLIPVDAAGAERLYDAFASLPGMQSAALLAALEEPAAGAPLPAGASRMRHVWSRTAAALAGRAAS